MSWNISDEEGQIKSIRIRKTVDQDALEISWKAQIFCLL